MNTQHTQGEWKVVQTSDQLSFKETTVVQIIRTKGSPFCVYTDALEHGSVEADARLIAAAPELLEALINQLEEIGVDPFGSIRGFSHKTQAAILAVQKATGKKEETL